MDVRVLLRRRTGELGTLSDTERDVGVRRSSQSLDRFRSASAAKGDDEYTGGGIERRSGEHLLEIEREDVGMIHHRCERTVNEEQRGICSTHDRE